MIDMEPECEEAREGVKKSTESSEGAKQCEERLNGEMKCVCYRLSNLFTK